MIIINTVSEKYFSLNGVNFAKIYQPLKQGSSAIGIYSIFDTRLQLQNSNDFDQFQINDVVYLTQAETITALLEVIFNAATASELSLLKDRVDNLEDNQVTGVEAYSTFADLPTTGTLLTSYKVTNDPDNTKNGYYHWSGTVYIKDYDLVQAGNSSTVTFKNTFGTWVADPNSPITASTITFDKTQAINGAVTAVYYKGNILDKTKFLNGTIVTLKGLNILNELCLILIVYDKTYDAFHVNIQTGFTGDLPETDIPATPVIDSIVDSDITINLNGGDSETANDDLKFQFYDADDSDSIILTANYTSIGSENEAGSDTGVIFTRDDAANGGLGQMILSNVDLGSATNIKVSVKDEANNESGLSAAKETTIQYKIDLDQANIERLKYDTGAALTLSGDFTLEMKVTLNDLSGIVYLMDGAGSTSSLTVLATGVIRYIPDNGGTTIDTTAGDVVASSTPQTIKVVKTGTGANNVEFFVDGVSVGTGTDAETTWTIYYMFGSSSGSLLESAESFKIINAGQTDTFDCNEGTGSVTNSNETAKFFTLVSSGTVEDMWEAV